MATCDGKKELTIPEKVSYLRLDIIYYASKGRVLCHWTVRHNLMQLPLYLAHSNPVSLQYFILVHDVQNLGQLTSSA